MMEIYHMLALVHYQNKLNSRDTSTYGQDADPTEQEVLEAEAREFKREMQAEEFGNFLRGIRETIASFSKKSRTRTNALAK